MLKANTFGIYGDSMAAIQTLTNVGSLHRLAVETRKKIKTASQDKHICLFWIKAHRGEWACLPTGQRDAVGSKRKLDYDLCPISFVQRSIRMQTLGEWNRSANANPVRLRASHTSYWSAQSLRCKGNLESEVQFKVEIGNLSSLITRKYRDVFVKYCCKIYLLFCSCNKEE